MPPKEDEGPLWLFVAEALLEFYSQQVMQVLLATTLLIIWAILQVSPSVAMLVLEATVALLLIQAFFTYPDISNWEYETARSERNRIEMMSFPNRVTRILVVLLVPGTFVLTLLALIFCYAVIGIIENAEQRQAQ